MSMSVKSMDLATLVGNVITTTSNVGLGEGLALPLVANDAPFKSLTAGANITLTPNATEIEISLPLEEIAFCPVRGLIAYIINKKAIKTLKVSKCVNNKLRIK